MQSKKNLGKKLFVETLGTNIPNCIYIDDPNSRKILKSESIENNIYDIFAKSKSNIMPKYSISYNNSIISIRDFNGNIIDSGKFELLNYTDKNNLNVINDLLYSIFHQFKNSSHSNIYKMPNEIECSVLYIYLIPVLTTSNEFIIKAGYSSDLATREIELIN